MPSQTPGEQPFDRLPPCPATLAGMERRHRIRIDGRRWLLVVGVRNLRDRWGDCDPPDSKRRRIRVADQARGTAFVDTLIHELIHARWWHLDETEVTEFAAEVTAVLQLLRDVVIEALEDE